MMEDKRTDVNPEQKIEVFKNADIPRNLSQVIDNERDINLAKRDKEDLIYKTDLSEMALVLEILTKESRTDVNPEQKLEEEVFKNADISQNLSQVIDYLRDINLSKPDMEDLIYKTDLPETALVPEILTKESRTDVNLEQKIEEEVFKNADIPRNLSQVIDNERDINLAKRDKEDLIYKTDLSETALVPEILTKESRTDVNPEQKIEEEVFKNADIFQNLFQVIDYIRDINLSKLDKEDIIYKTDLSEIALVPEILTRESRTDVNLEQKIEEEVFKNADISQNLSQVIDNERDINLAKPDKEDLTKELQFGKKETNKETKGKLDKHSDDDPDESSHVDDSAANDKSEDEDESGRDQESKFVNSARPKHETKEERKARKKAFKEKKAEKRKTKVKKHVKKRAMKLAKKGR